MEDSGLRGLGGAGFPAGRKWRIVREQAVLAASRRAAPSEATAPSGGSGPHAVGERGGDVLMAVNIDEGEPGTFKDRTYLERDPHRFLEGLLVAAQVVGVDACYIYLRDEYHGCRALLEAELAQLQANPPCRLPTIELRRGAGAYICLAGPRWSTTSRPCTGCATLWKKARPGSAALADMAARACAVSVSVAG